MASHKNNSSVTYHLVCTVSRIPPQSQYIGHILSHKMSDTYHLNRTCQPYTILYIQYVSHHKIPSSTLLSATYPHVHTSQPYIHLSTLVSASYALIHTAATQLPINPHHYQPHNHSSTSLSANYLLIQIRQPHSHSSTLMPAWSHH